jgi:predicted dehydrogenase
VQIFGAGGAIAFDQERMNEVEFYVAEGPVETRGFRKIIAGPVHEPYGRFTPAPGHQIGFNDLKVIEARALIGRIEGGRDPVIDFDEGLAIERTVHAIARSHESGRWTPVDA